MVKLWLDDERPKPADFDCCVKTAATAIRMLRVGGVTMISLDHDLGSEENGSGYDVAKFIEEAAYKGTLPPIEVRVHSANPVGRKRMLAAIERAQLFWSQEAAK